MQIIKYIFIIIFVLYTIYAIYDFIKNININNTLIVNKQLTKFKIRLVIAVCIFIFPFGLNYTLNNSNNNAEEIIKIDDNYLDSNYVWNEDKNYYESQDKNEIVKIVSISDDIYPDNENNNKTKQMIIYNQSTIKKLDNFTYYNQCDKQWQTRGFCSNNYSICGNGCGATSLAMIASSLGNNKKVTPLDVRDYLCKNNLHSNGGMSYAPFTNKNLLDEFGLNGNVIINYNESSIYDKKKAQVLETNIKKGNGVILLIPGHYVVLGKNKTCNANQVYMYDPESRDTSKCYTMEELWTKTWNIKNRCYNEKKCGWRMAWSYTSKK